MGKTMTKEEFEMVINNINSEAYSRYHEHFNNELYNKARDHELEHGCVYDEDNIFMFGNVLIDMALGLCGHLSYSLTHESIRRLPDNNPWVLEFLRQFIGDERILQLYMPRRSK